MNYVTGNRFFTVAADLSESINVEHGSLWGHYDPETNPLGTRLKAPIQEAGNVSTAIGLISQSASVDPGAVRRRMGAERHLRRLHAADVHAGARLEPAEPGQPFPHGRAAHSRRRTRGRRRRPTRAPTSAFSRRRCGSCSRAARPSTSISGITTTWPPGYFAAAEIAARDPKVGIITIEVARPDFPVADRCELRR